MMQQATWCVRCILWHKWKLSSQDTFNLIYRDAFSLKEPDKLLCNTTLFWSSTTLSAYGMINAICNICVTYSSLNHSTLAWIVITIFGNYNETITYPQYFCLIDNACICKLAVRLENQQCNGWNNMTGMKHRCRVFIGPLGALIQFFYGDGWLHVLKCS